MALHPDHFKNLYSLKLNQGLGFVASHGTLISPRNLIRHFKQALKVDSLPEIRFYDLRRTHASLLLSAGVHPKLVQERLRHLQINLTLDTYSHIIPSLQKEATPLDETLGQHMLSKVLDESFGGKGTT